MSNTWPIGDSITLAMLDADPYPIFKKLRQEEPVSWVPDLGMWLVTRRDDVRTILKDPDTFTTYSENSLIFDTFGENMLTIDGAQQKAYKSKCRRPFLPSHVDNKFSGKIRAYANQLVDEFIHKRAIDLQHSFSSRLPVLTTLSVFGMPDEAESEVRRWYDSFEAALANFRWDKGIRDRARESVTEFGEYLQSNINELQLTPNDSLLSLLANTSDTERLTDEQIRHNAYITFFGGISTVEALISNTVWAILSHPQASSAIVEDRSKIPLAIEETLRWESPVQSCTRHVTRDTSYKGVNLKKGDIVNCMLGAANRDERVYTRPEQFDIARSEQHEHIAFGHGVHFCLGAPLARLEGRIAVEVLLQRLPGMQLESIEQSRPQGSEFRKPASLHVNW